MASGFRLSTDVNCRSLGFAPNDKLKGGDSPRREWRWMDESQATRVSPYQNAHVRAL
jgi:hypothetical protein